MYSLEKLPIWVKYASGLGVPGIYLALASTGQN